MRQREVDVLDAAVNKLAPGAEIARELLAVVDVLEDQPSLRRALSDPSAAAADRADLVKRLFGQRVEEKTLAVLALLAEQTWSGPKRMIEALERQGIRILLRSAKTARKLPQVQAELLAFSQTVAGNAELDDILRSRFYPLAARRSLVASLTAGKVLPVTASLLERATAARLRTVPATIESYLELAASLNQQQIAKVTLARPLDQARQDRLRAALEAQIGGPVSLQLEVDPQVLGGMNIQWGQTIIESTVAGRLDDARRLLHTK